MAYLDSEAELAGVLGHEIGHVTARHGAQRATRQQTAGLGVLAATVLGAVLEAKGVAGAAEGLAGGAGRGGRLHRELQPRPGKRRPTSSAPSTWRAATTTRTTWST